MKGGGTVDPFLLTPLCEGRPKPSPGRTGTGSDFYSRPSARGDIIPAENPVTSLDSYSRPSARGDNAENGEATAYTIISTHAPLRGATETVTGKNRYGERFLLTPLCEGRLEPAFSWAGSQPISTHAPLRGATGRPHLPGGADPISTHAPLRGATSRAERGDEDDCISTHAPLRGATAPIASAAAPATISTHAPLRGATDYILIDCPPAFISTHAPLRGATPMSISSGEASPNFYSRPSARGDATEASVPKPVKLFLLTPLCEGRPPCSPLSGNPGNKFLLTPLCEGRPF